MSLPVLRASNRLQLRPLQPAQGPILSRLGSQCRCLRVVSSAEVRRSTVRIDGVGIRCMDCNQIVNRRSEADISFDSKPTQSAPAPTVFHAPTAGSAPLDVLRLVEDLKSQSLVGFYDHERWEKLENFLQRQQIGLA